MESPLLCDVCMRLARYMTLPFEDAVSFKEVLNYCIVLDLKRWSLHWQQRFVIVVSMASCLKVNVSLVWGAHGSRIVSTLTPGRLASGDLVGTSGKTGKPAHHPKSQWRAPCKDASRYLGIVPSIHVLLLLFWHGHSLGLGCVGTFLLAV